MSEPSSRRRGRRSTGVQHDEGALAYQLRDRHGASRAVAYLCLAGSPFALFTSLFLSNGLDTPALFGTVLASVAIGVGGLACFFRPRAMPGYFWLIVPTMATFIISGLNLITRDASTGSQLFYLWPVLYAANFLSRRATYVNIAFVLAGEATVLVVVLGVEDAAPDWAAMALALSMTAVMVVTLRDRADLLLRRLEGQALADPLTGLANRRSFDEELERAGRWTARTGRPLAVITIDVDHFKTINDTWGHAVGDRALQAVADALRSVAEQTDVAARLGGDEFVMLMRTDRRGALRTAEALRAQVAAVGALPSGPPRLSIGVAVLPDHADTVEDLVGASDTALYDAKTGGRGRIAVARAHRHNVDRVPPAPAPADAGGALRA